MANNLEHLARRLEDDPFFLACSLKHYAKSEGLTGEKLASGLKCTEESLLRVQLCRAPTADDDSFFGEIERIATRFSVDAQALAEAVRRGQAICEMTTTEHSAGTLLAARDGENQKTDDTNGGRHS